MQSIEEFYVDLFQEIVSRQAVKKCSKEEAFFETVKEQLIDLGEFEDAIYTHYHPEYSGLQVDGYCGDPLEDTVAREANAGVLGLIIVNFSGNKKLETITQTTLNTLAKRISAFIQKSLDYEFRFSLEESDPGYEVADLIEKRWNILTRIKVYIFTDKALSTRAKGLDSTTIKGKPVVYDLWDANRLYRLSLSGRERENLEIDFTRLPNGPLRALRAGSGKDVGEVFLAAIPGLDLAAIYDRWGTRLLEQNVRVFLQARSNVNKGIKSTLEHNPELFFSFNNGLTTTAEHVETIETEEGTKIVRLDNLQIVNGAQTTASIYAAYRKKIDLSDVYVQMKLNVISPAKAIDLVPQISRSANSQNRISDADFFSNHPFHVRIEEFSRRLWAPPAEEGSFVQTKWYYERARGQYRDDQAHMSAGDRKKFGAEYPKTQVFNKTDLAKYLMVWTDQGYFVNRGAQKNFAQFAKTIAAEWEKDNTQFSEYYFRCLIAKKIIFNATERIVSDRTWYQPGLYRSQHVVLTLGLLSNLVNRMKKAVDFESIWQAQKITDDFRKAIGLASDVAHEVLMNPKGSHNISEWAKSPDCWTALMHERVTWNEAWLRELQDKAAEREAQKEAKKDQKELNSIEAQMQVMAMGNEFWADVLRWGIENHELTDKEISYLRSATRASRRPPQDWRCVEIIKLMDRLVSTGCPYKIRLTKDTRHRRRRSV